MKTFNSYLTLFAFVSLVGISCQKTESLKDREILNENSTNSSLLQSIGGDPGKDLLGLTYCNAKVVPICAGQTINVGEVSVQTAIDGRTIITYSIKSNWYFQEIHLYVGDREG